MAIPGARMEDVPPALPPPRYIQDLDDGVDISWRYQNDVHTNSRLAPIKAGSSLYGRAPRPSDEDIDMDMDMDYESSSQPQIPLHLATGTSLPSLKGRPPSSSGITQRLHGENPLAQHNHSLSTHAYDKHLLLKIGKSHSPGHSRSELGDHPSKLSIQTRGPNLQTRPMQESSAWDKYMASPSSAVSSANRFSWRESSMNPRTPVSDSKLYGIDPELTTKPRTGSTHSPGNTRTRSERGSYDSAYSVSDEHSSTDDKPRPIAYHGVKRRALSPPHQAGYEQGREPLKRLQSRPDLQGVAANQPSKAGSLSSSASSNNYHSYASSTMLSSASSMTSISSLDTPLSREPSRQLFSSPTSANSTSGVAILPLRRAPELANRTPIQADQRSEPSRIGNYWMCACCPKKPRKFDSEEQLRTHEGEKQYICTYCNNRFKNKNEAERHQNSLHVRKQSWSCATISTYQAAFHPASASSPRNLAAAICGFCGEEFSDRPPNWEERIEHLTNVHKFGECNATKKFYRADHFRQHLKHSHAGKSGKWTNILENKCQREEALSEPASLSPTASEHSQSGRHANPADTSPSGVETIDEVWEES